MREIDRRLEKFSIRLDAVREWILTKNLACHCQILWPEHKALGNPSRQCFLRQLLRFQQCRVQVERKPGILPVDVTPDNYCMISGNKAVCLEESCAFGDFVWKERLDFAPIAARRSYPCRTIDDVLLRSKSAAHGSSIELMVNKHRRQTLIFRDALELDPLWRDKFGRAAMAKVLGPFHPPLNLILRHAKIVLENTARPECRCLLVIPHADSLADKVVGVLDS